METPEYRNIFVQEKTHFFYVATHRVVLSLVKRFTLGKSLKIFDAGCGTGLLAKKLERFGRVWGIDISLQAVKFAKNRGVRVKQASVDKIPFKDDSFDLVVCVDVIYHKLVNDKKALREFFRVLRPGGILVLRVPAVPWLATSHDKHVHTRERYTKSVLTKKLVDAGFSVEKISGVDLLLVPVALVRHFWEKIVPPSRPESGVTKLPGSVNSTLSFILGLEEYLLRWVDLPIGLGLVAVCRKPYAIK
ncbi:MAG: class I SAM-dependent methyltransferase [bacterium]|nr:class I SAM-dependent methyltransferase [bacterium]